jgi:protein TIF31
MQSASSADGFVSTSSTVNNHAVDSNKNKKNKKNKKKPGQPLAQNDQNELTPRNLWSNIIEEALLQYHFEIKNETNIIEDLLIAYKLRKMTLLRSFCQKNGVQLLLREYNLENKHKELFHEDDILNLYPLVKHAPTKVHTLTLCSTKSLVESHVS